MPEDKTTAPRPVEPLTIPIIATGDASVLPRSVEAITPGDHQPNVVIKAVQPLVAILIRFLNTFFVQLVGLLVAAMTPTGSSVLHARDFVHLVLLCASLAIPGAGLGFFKDLVTVFGRLEQKFPLATGSV